MVKFALATAFTCFNVVIFSGLAVADSYQYYPNSPLHLGASFDPRKMSNMFPPCVKYDGVVQAERLGATGGATPPLPPSNAVATETEFSIKEVKTRQEMYSYLHVSASVSGHYSFFSGSASVDYERENTFESDSFTWVVRAYSKFGTWLAVNPRLNEAASALRTNPDALYTRCGTEWVGQESRAVLVAIVYSVKNLSESSRERLTASFKGGIDAGVWGADAAAAYESFKKEASSAANINVNVYALGGPGIPALKELVSKGTDIATLKKTMEDYTSKLTVDNSVPTDYLSGSLRSLSQIGADYDLSTYNNAIANLYFAREDYQAKLNRIRQIINQADDYNLNDAKIAEYGKHYDGIAKVVESFNDVARACRNAFLSARGNRIADERISAAACKTTDPRLVYRTRIVWPAPQPFKIEYYTEDYLMAPKRWLYVTASGPRLSEAAIKTNDGTILTGLKVEEDPLVGKKATGQVEFSGIAGPKFPLIVEVKSESGTLFEKKLPLSQAVPAFVALPAGIGSKQLTVRSVGDLKQLNTKSLFRFE